MPKYMIIDSKTGKQKIYKKVKRVKKAEPKITEETKTGEISWKD